MLPYLIKSTTASDTARLVIVASDAHFRANKLKGVANWPSILGKLNDEEYCTASVMKNRYELSKLLQVMFVRELASRLLNPTPVSVTNLVMKLMVHVGKALLARTTEMESHALVHPAVEPSERDRHGRYVSCVEVAEESDYALSEERKEFSRRLWEETIEILAKIDPRVNQIISQHLLAR
ncbi:hypothetical protein L210DRAFT_3560183 [Boletus edulis BED1]|uniref:Uncharacterized protein n=1 Tax=Boletus edulis BED1 TaxID=1328754 RepID=A0AAD4G9P2_BOLED|nr:hypothetical protein L210DRAFT_3560183 [Boletus edulis BED1]